MTLRLGIDTGGTFTDIVNFDEQSGRLTFHKLGSTPADPSQAIVDGVCSVIDGQDIPPTAVSLLVHGTTVATNAVLEAQGARVALITTAGFRDVLEIQRQDRPRLYDLRARRSRPLVPRKWRFELNERMLFDGSVRTSVDRQQLDELIRVLECEGIEAVAVGFLHSYANPQHELEVGEIIAGQLPDVTICLSHEIVREHGEYERFSTCVMNAFVQPVMKRYLTRLASRLSEAKMQAPLLVMKSNGGVMSAERAARRCVDTILSGPSGGVMAGVAIAQAHSNQNLITADMGGTSFDVSVIHKGSPAFARHSEMGGLALGVPLLDIHTVGAGGGSIAWIDAGGALRVGPRSAGAMPGPACYGRGGTAPTVTDANLVLGRLSANSLLGGAMCVDVEAARRAIHDAIAQPTRMSIEHAAEGIIRIVNATMTAAMRKLTVERGLDPREFVLCPFGGAGPLHGAELAAELGIRETLVPIAPGVTSAIGLLMSNLREDHVQTFVAPLTDEVLAEVDGILAQLITEATDHVALADSTRSVRQALGIRYRGQRYELSVAVTGGALDGPVIEAAFHHEHERAYGFSRADEEMEIASVWVSVEAEVQGAKLPRAEPSLAEPEPCSIRTVVFAGRPCETPVFRRDAFGAGAELSGPAIVEQLDATTVVWPGQSLHTDDYGQLVLGPIRD